MGISQGSHILPVRHWIELSRLKMKVSGAALPSVGWRRHLGVVEQIPESFGLDYIVYVKLGVI